MERLPRIKNKRNKKVKTRKSWTLHPGEKVVPNAKGKRPNKKQLEAEALDDYEEVG